MKGQILDWRWAGLLAFSLCSIGASPTLAQTAITAATDGTGTTVNFDATTQTYTIDGGTQIEANLFHSFQQFGLSSTEMANFLAQPDIANILARVTGGQASVIDGLLQVSGGNSTNLFILNPAGILLGHNTNLNLAGSFSASTASGIAFGNQVFNATGGNTYSALTGNPSGYVFLGHEGVLLNEANLVVNPGQGITLAGSTVINTGSLDAPEGRISIVAVPEEGILKIAQDGLVLSLALSTDQLQNLGLGERLTPLDLPSLLAGEWGGSATHVSTLSDGTVVLGAGQTPINSTSGSVTVAGSLTVSGQTAGQVQVLGQIVGLTGSAIAANGNSGGGQIWIGGNYLGQGDLPTAQSTSVDRATQIAANAMQSGNGGRVIVWADEATTFAGQISARGGSLSGHGGFVETSGAQSLDFAGGTVDASAPNGTAGLWLLDPSDITIGTTQANAIVTALAGGTSVELTTLGGTGGNGDISLTASINATGVNAATNSAVLTLTASRYITRTASNTIAIQNGGLVLNLNQEGLAAEQNPTVRDALATIGTVTNGATVNLAAGTYREQAAISLNNANTAITLNGAGAGQTLFSGDSDANGTQDHPVISIGSSSRVTLNGITVTEGASSSGAGISNSGILTLNNSTVSGNTVTSTTNSNGGGISGNGTLTLNNSTVSNNSATGRGGGIFLGSGGTLTLNNSTVSNNSANMGGGIYQADNTTVNLDTSLIANNVANDKGGGFFNAGGTLNVNQSTLSGNASSTDFGGGLYGQGNNVITFTNSTVIGNSATVGGGISILNNGSLTLRNSTVSGNTASNGGGGIYSQRTPLRLINSTVSGNTSNANGGGLYSIFSTTRLTSSTVSGNSARLSGGGIYAAGFDTIISHSIVAGNTAASGSEIRQSGSGSLISSYSLLGTNGASGLVGATPSATDIVPTVALSQILAPLANNGGATQTHALVWGSPAMNAGEINYSGSLTLDQRGQLRIQQGRIDIGAVEYSESVQPEAQPISFALRLDPLTPLPMNTPVDEYPLLTLDPDLVPGYEQAGSGNASGNTLGNTSDASIGTATDPSHCLTLEAEVDTCTGKLN